MKRGMSRLGTEPPIDEGRDRDGRLHGWYDPRQNETRDADSRLVGRGDLLTVLITALR